mmetsp:Transcript_65168/g.153431  ORF Transcript_65168/g.153431 Transcript_65168/m.153431 type:complete len:278 (+) Transcript_65168:214-1047(+)
MALRCSTSNDIFRARFARRSTANSFSDRWACSNRQSTNSKSKCSFSAGSSFSRSCKSSWISCGGATSLADELAGLALEASTLSAGRIACEDRACQGFEGDTGGLGAWSGGGGTKRQVWGATTEPASFCSSGMSEAGHAVTALSAATADATAPESCSPLRSRSCRSFAEQGKASGKLGTSGNAPGHTMAPSELTPSSPTSTAFRGDSGYAFNLPSATGSGAGSRSSATAAAARKARDSEPMSCTGAAALPGASAALAASSSATSLSWSISLMTAGFCA